MASRNALNSASNDSSVRAALRARWRKRSYGSKRRLLPRARMMRARGIDTVIVPMHEAVHAAFRWISRGAKVTRGYVVKPIDQPPLMLAYPMERDEAAATGLKTRLIHEFGYDARIGLLLICRRLRRWRFDNRLDRVVQPGALHPFDDDESLLS